MHLEIKILEYFILDLQNSDKQTCASATLYGNIPRILNLGGLNSNVQKEIMKTKNFEICK